MFIKVQFVALIILAIISAGCASNNYKLIEKSPQGDHLNTYKTDYDNADEIYNAIIVHFAGKEYSDAILWGNAYLNEWGSKADRDTVANVSMLTVLSHLSQLEKPSELETIYFNNGHIQAAINKLQNPYLKRAGEQYCAKKLKYILVKGAYNEEAMFAFVRTLIQSVHFSGEKFQIVPNRNMDDVLQAINNKYPKWYEDMGIESWKECLITSQS